MKTPFKIGDRVAVYENIERRVSVIESVGANGIIRLVGSSIRFHPKQCRRLIPKKRREIWIIERDGFLYPSLVTLLKSESEVTGDKWIRFVEAKKKD